MNYFFELFFFHSGMIVHHTSLMTWEKKNTIWAHKFEFMYAEVYMQADPTI